MLRAFKIENSAEYRDFENKLFTNPVRIQQFDHANDRFMVDDVWYKLSTIKRINDENDLALLNAESKTKVLHTATIPVGAIGVNDTVPIGSSLDDFAEQLVAPYVAPILNSITISGSAASPFEVGYNYNVLGSQISAQNDSEGNAPRNIKILGNGFQADVIRSVGYNAPDDPATTTVTRTTAGNIAWTMTAEDKNGNPIASRSTSKAWYYRFFFGASTVAITDDASAQAVIDAMQQSWIQSGKSRTVTATADNNNANNFTDIAFCRSLGATLADVKLGGVESVLGSFYKVGEFNYVNALGTPMIMVIYRTSAKGAFAIGQTLAIS